MMWHLTSSTKQASQTTTCLSVVKKWCATSPLILISYLLDACMNEHQSWVCIHTCSNLQTKRIYWKLEFNPLLHTSLHEIKYKAILILCLYCPLISWILRDWSNTCLLYVVITFCPISKPFASHHMPLQGEYTMGALLLLLVHMFI